MGSNRALTGRGTSDSEEPVYAPAWECLAGPHCPGVRRCEHTGTGRITVIDGRARNTLNGAVAVEDARARPRRPSVLGRQHLCRRPRGGTACETFLRRGTGNGQQREEAAWDGLGHPGRPSVGGGQDDASRRGGRFILTDSEAIVRRRTCDPGEGGHSARKHLTRPARSAIGRRQHQGDAGFRPCRPRHEAVTGRGARDGAQVAVRGDRMLIDDRPRRFRSSSRCRGIEPDHKSEAQAGECRGDERRSPSSTSPFSHEAAPVSREPSLKPSHRTAFPSPRGTAPSAALALEIERAHLVERQRSLAGQFGLGSERTGSEMPQRMHKIVCQKSGESRSEHDRTTSAEIMDPVRREPSPFVRTG
jgi:hypothetical protein